MVRKNLDQRPGPARTRLDDVLARSGLSGAALVSAGDLLWQAGDVEAPFVIYSLTKPVICAALLLLADAGEITLDATLPDDRVGRPTIRQLMTHTAGVRDYGGLAEYHQAVRRSPSEPWGDEEFLRRVLGGGPGTGPGLGWAYSNTGYLLLRQILDRHGGLASFLPDLGFVTATVAEQLTDLTRAVPAHSSLIGTEPLPVAGRYHPGWVGHRTMVTSARELHRFWSKPPPAFTDLANLVTLDIDTGGLVVRPSYGLGVMADPGNSIGLVIGHGGGGPGYSAAVFAAPEHGAIAVVLEPREDFESQQLAMELLQAAVQDRI
ncbi:MAG TPA: serine hydrolase domain-containing protein [Streptosporangiaceae bacterium]|nr:serine hydrolase domain-containing protein [Streptosporangiaceae bacterium]